MYPTFVLPSALVLRLEVTALISMRARFKDTLITAPWRRSPSTTSDPSGPRINLTASSVVIPRVDSPSMLTITSLG